MGDPVRYRCAGCGNVTRFDVVAARRTRSFHHYNLAGELTIEDEALLDERIVEVTCRWCGATGATVEAVAEPSAETAS
ncbi:MAG TPA: hypothetical protein VLV81_13885 [Acidimicrobiia bacterium]|nr:hypothetical protein [Acidimicrobiia bacterium]